MRSGTLDRRKRILESLPLERRNRVKELKARISIGEYFANIEDKLAMVAEDLLDEAVKLRG